MRDRTQFLMVLLILVGMAGLYYLLYRAYQAYQQYAPQLTKLQNTAASLGTTASGLLSTFSKL